MKKEIEEGLLIRYVIGEATPEERADVEHWAEIHEDNKKELEETRFILENTKVLSSESPADVEAEWERFTTNRAKQDNNNNNYNSKIISIRYNKWLQAAAAVVLLIGGWIGFRSWSGHQKDDLIILSTQGVPVKDTLPDGTEVTLNKFSKLTYSAEFQNHRQVSLIGEAFFNVVHDGSRPFAVQSSGVTIRDIGTSFNVSNHAKTVTVLVEEGIVEVSAVKTLARLVKNEQLSIDPAGDLSGKAKVNDHLHDYYRTGVFSADHTPLARLVNVLKDAYNIDIVIRDRQLDSIPITGNFKTGPIDTILTLLQLSTPELNFYQQGNTIFVKKR